MRQSYFKFLAKRMLSPTAFPLRRPVLNKLQTARRADVNTRRAESPFGCPLRLIVRSHRHRLPEHAFVDTARPDFNAGSLGRVLSLEVTQTCKKSQAKPGRRKRAIVGWFMSRSMGKPGSHYPQAISRCLIPLPFGC